VTYDWEITNSTCDPDGTGGRTCFLVNGQYPGPVLRATWGDNVVVNIKNSLQDNGTSVHWHGVRQLNSPGSDGTGGITECPIAPGDTRTYSFKVTQYGTSLYHSHFEAQYGDGVIGPIVFDGPAAADYDIDLGPYPINEWYYKTAWQVDSLGLQALQNAASGALPPHTNTILINGTNKNANGSGEYSQVSITPGKKHLLRLVNIGIDNYLRISLDGHVMQMISADFVPVEPF
jgi:FtsP/CotA-like multicopper oxidase with cupredoxin domain